MNCVMVISLIANLIFFILIYMSISGKISPSKLVNIYGIKLELLLFLKFKLRSMMNAATNLDIYQPQWRTRLDLPFVEQGISAGFPSPADDFLDLSIDLNKEFIQHPNTTFYGRVRGDSMIDAGLHDGDLLIIDKSLEPQDGKIAVCFVDGEFTVKRIKKDQNAVWLVAENQKYKPIRVTADNDFLIWGVVTTVIKQL